MWVLGPISKGLRKRKKTQRLFCYQRMRKKEQGRQTTNSGSWQEKGMRKRRESKPFSRTQESRPVGQEAAEQ